MVKKLIRLGFAGIVSLGIGTAAPVVFADNPMSGAADKAADTTENAAKSAGASANSAASSTENAGKDMGDKASDATKNAADITSTKSGSVPAGPWNRRACTRTPRQMRACWTGPRWLGNGRAGEDSR